MSNTIVLRALTGETARTKSLADWRYDDERRFCAILHRRHHFTVPVIAHDIDWPSVRLINGHNGVGPQWWSPDAASYTPCLERIVALGGTVSQHVHLWTQPAGGLRARPGDIRWTLPGDLDPDVVVAVLGGVTHGEALK